MLPALVCAAFLQNGVVIRDLPKDIIRVQAPCQIEDQDLSIMYQWQTRRQTPSRVLDPDSSRFRWLER